MCAVYHSRYRIASRNSTFPDGTATLTVSLANDNTPTTTDAIGTQKQANRPNYWARYCVTRTSLYNCGLEQAPEQHLVENMINTGITSGIQQQTTHAPRPGSFLCVESQECCFGTHQ